MFNEKVLFGALFLCPLLHISKKSCNFAGEKIEEQVLLNLTLTIKWNEYENTPFYTRYLKSYLGSL